MNNGILTSPFRLVVFLPLAVFWSPPTYAWPTETVLACHWDSGKDELIPIDEANKRVTMGGPGPVEIQRFDNSGISFRLEDDWYRDDYTIDRATGDITFFEYVKKTNHTRSEHGRCHLR